MVPGCWYNNPPSCRTGRVIGTAARTSPRILNPAIAGDAPFVHISLAQNNIVQLNTVSTLRSRIWGYWGYRIRRVRCRSSRRVGSWRGFRATICSGPPDWPIPPDSATTRRNAPAPPSARAWPYRGGRLESVAKMSNSYRWLATNGLDFVSVLSDHFWSLWPKPTYDSTIGWRVDTGVFLKIIIWKAQCFYFTQIAYTPTQAPKPIDLFSLHATHRY